LATPRPVRFPYLIPLFLIANRLKSASERSYTPVKGVGDGSFGTVWLCDWHTPLPPSISLAPMQQGAGAKREWQGKRLVAIKRMKKRWDGGWDECRRHPELEVSPSTSIGNPVNPLPLTILKLHSHLEPSHRTRM
jgi:meiosis induction protein kinase IME2/SME1